MPAAVLAKHVMVVSLDHLAPALYCSLPRDLFSEVWSAGGQGGGGGGEGRKKQTRGEVN